MQSLIVLLITISLITLGSSVQLQTEEQEPSHKTHSGLKRIGFTEPIEIYSGNIKGQTVLIDYSKGIGPKATKVQFMIFFDIGDASTSAITYNFIEVYNTRDFHYNSIVGRSESTYWSHFSESFTFETDGTNKVTLSIDKSFGGTNHVVKLYVTGYYL